MHAFRPFDYCAIDPYGDAFTPMWTWVLNATYREGVFEFMGKLVGVWTYKVSHGNFTTCNGKSKERI